MKTSLRHLPKEKQVELKMLVAKLHEEVDGVEMIVLFGSYARGDWRDEAYEKDNVFYQYRSDYDIMVVVENELPKSSDHAWQRLNIKLEKLRDLNTPLSLIGMDINSLNGKLSDGDDFYSDVKKDGIWLYNSRRFKLARARRLKPEERRRFAEEDYKEWYKSANSFLIDFGHAFERRDYKKAAFELHQAAERFYSTTLKVFTRSRPRIHDIERLGRKVASLDPRFMDVFPRASKNEQHCFDLLKRAYVDARYDPSYKITKKELEYLGDRVKKLRTLTRKICKEKIKSFTDQA